MKLGVNIDHIAVLREARRIADPNPLDALNIVKLAGGDQITIHLREDRRHIQDIDAINIVRESPLPVNLECALSSDIIGIVSNLKPHRATLVPEKREEVTTEGGLDISKNIDKLKRTIEKLQRNEIEVSLFIDPSLENVEMSKSLGVEWVEFHTGRYANAYAMLFGNLSKTHHTIENLDISRKGLSKTIETELKMLRKCSSKGVEVGLKIASGHGLNYQNVQDIVRINKIEELNIGQSIIARAVFVGLERAILDMKELLKVK